MTQNMKLTDGEFQVALAPWVQQFMEAKAAKIHSPAVKVAAPIMDQEYNEQQHCNHNPTDPIYLLEDVERFKQFFLTRKGHKNVNIRDYAFNKHQSVDDYPYGGGAGMLMQAEPVYQCYQAIQEKINAAKREKSADIDKKEKSISEKRTRVLYMSPQGRTFSQRMAEELAEEEELIFLCGHYEGIDERVLEEIVTDYVSIGDYVLTGGELPAMVMVDAISRMVPGVLSNEASGSSESFEDCLLVFQTGDLA